MTITGEFVRFQYLNFETSFRKKLEYCFLVQSTTNESAIFPYKTALLKANVRQIESGVQNGPTTKNGLLKN